MRDHTEDKRKFRMLTMIDELTWRCLAFAATVGNGHNFNPGRSPPEWRKEGSQVTRWRVWINLILH